MLTVDSLRSELSALRAATSKPFNVNFFCHNPPAPNAQREAAWRAALAPYYAEFGLDIAAVQAGAGRSPFSAEAADVLEDVKPAVVSFHFGLPSPELLARVRGWGSKVLASATTVDEALWLEARGVDAIIAQGLEAGGHRGIFLSDDLTTRSAPSPVAADRGRSAHAGDRGRRHRRRTRRRRRDAPGLQPVCSWAPPTCCAPRRPPARASRRAAKRGRPPYCVDETIHRSAGTRHRQPLDARARAAEPGGTGISACHGSHRPVACEGRELGSGDFSPLWSGQNASGCKRIPAAQLTHELAAEL
jgi:nitronate monooxygenase